MNLDADPPSPGAGQYELVALPAIAELLGVSITQVHNLVRDGQLVAVRPAGGVRVVPAAFVQDGAIVKGLPGVITLLRDAGFSDDEIVDWLHRPDDSLRSGSAMEELRTNRGTEIKRRAQSAGF